VLDDLPRMTLRELREAWALCLGGDPPRLRTRELLALSLGYRLQARREGDVSATIRRRLSELERRFAEDRRYSPQGTPVLKPGSSLVREWRGVRHEVRVLENGFSYRGERLSSLSEAAQKITGTKWNGLVFFGLKERGR
ncbi:MAG: DUF2924 domain-containing protein, partial [Caulobacteraceae bacterium]